jgi:nucleoside-diphosphate-sugar epimerase
VVSVSLFEPDALGVAVAGYEVVVNLATHIPSLAKSGLPWAWLENEAVRTEGARNLVRAAQAGGVSRFVQESVVFGYGDGGDAWIDEDWPIQQTSITASSQVAERSALGFADDARTAVILRFGSSYGPDSGHTVARVRAARMGIGLVVGPESAYSSNIHVDDAASAVVAALQVQSGVYNVVEDEPLTRREQLKALAAAVGRARLVSAGRLIASLGGSRTSAMARSQRVSNRRFLVAALWRPTYASVRQGWPAVIAAMEGRSVTG